MINTAVFEQSPDNAPHPDIVRKPLDAGPQRANAAHDEIDLDTRLRSLVKGIDQLWIGEAVHLGDYSCRASMPGMLGLATDQFEHFFTKVDRGNYQFLIFFTLRID